MSSLGPLQPTGSQASVPPSTDQQPTGRHTITEASVTELSVETTGVLPGDTRGNDVRIGETPGTLSKVALGLSVASLVLAPLFGVGAVLAIVALILSHVAKRGDQLGRLRAMVAMGVSYVALVVGTAVAVLVTLPIALAFLISTGFILAG